ncbi:MAG: molybdopterin-dependent oxidoreductase [Eggerthellales bacterium]|nr:molybdopterin-dependent oxidoreductase [Eggerthellales bacterium]
MENERSSKIVEGLSAKHEGTEFKYTCCAQNGCWDASCILKCEVKDGKLISISADDSINPGCPREDVGDQALREGMVQMRPCAMGHAWKGEIEADTRILYPMKRIGGHGPGNGHFERISWDEAIDTIADKLIEFKEKYGPYFLAHTTDDCFEECGFKLAPWFGVGMKAWGDNSCSGTTLGEKLHLGFDMVGAFHGKTDLCVGFEAPDLLNSKLIVIWGMDPLIGWYGSVSYYMKLAKEKGAKVIVIDPRYTNSAETLGDQWLPIRPGTDLAMMLAVAYVLYTEDLYDHEYVEKWVEPVGFEKWREYVTGKTDGIEKTPEWAEAICAIPAETIRAFAHLYAESTPVHLHYYYGPAKRHLGEYSATAAMLLQAMTGNLSIPGGCQTGCSLVTPARMPFPMVDWQQAPAEYDPPIVHNIQKIAESVVKRPLFDAGEITEEEYREFIGSPPGAPLPNIKMMIFENNYPVVHHHSNKRLQAMEMSEFNWGFQWHMNQSCVEYLDIVLPGQVLMFETRDNYMLGSERFMYGPNGMRNYFLYADKICDAPGEVRPRDWFYTQLAKRLGIVDKFNPRMADVAIEDWDDAIHELYHEAYDAWAADPTGQLAALGIEPKPWEEFLKKPIVRIPIDEAFYPYKNYMETGRNPFYATTSQKIEFSSQVIEKYDFRTESWYRGGLESMPVWDPSYMEGKKPNDSFYNPKAEQYPLSLVTPVSAYRQHGALDRNMQLHDECYRHAVWISPSDAKQRGVVDGETVRIFNEYGELQLQAYVTSRMMPGTAAIFHGEWIVYNGEPTETMPNGVDVGGACNFLIGDEHAPHIVGDLLTAGLVQVAKIEEVM